MQDSALVSSTFHPDPLVVVDAESGRVVAVNDHFCDLVGRDREALSEETVDSLDATPADGPEPRLAHYFDRVRETGRQRFDGRLRGERGTVPVDVTASATTHDGRECVVAAVRDDTDRHDYERRLERYRQRMEGAMLAGDVAWWEMDVGTGHVEFHENKVRTLDYDPNRFDHYEDFTELLHPDDHDRAMDAMRRHLEGDAERYEVEYRIRAADGDYHWFHDVGGITSWTDDGAPATVTGIVIDVSDRKQAETALREKTDQLALLNRIVRHDIRNDMAVALGWLDVLATETDDEVDEYVDRITRACRHVVDLTEAVRDLVDVVTTDAEATIEPVSLRPVLTAEVERVREQYDATVSLSDDVPDVSVLANAMLSSVFGNILSNAIEHNDADQPRVRVDVDVTDDAVRVRIADNGPGISPERQAAIFEHGEKGLESEGTGLGLYLVQTLVTAYGGDVWVEDADLGGAAFCVELRTV